MTAPSPSAAYHCGHMNTSGNFLVLRDAARPTLLIDKDTHLLSHVFEDDGFIIDSLLLNAKVGAVSRTGIPDAAVLQPLPEFGAELPKVTLIAKERAIHGYWIPPRNQSKDGAQDPPSRPPSPPLPSPLPPSPDRTPEPIRDPHRPEHPDPVREPPSDRPPVAVTFARIKARQRPRSFAFPSVCSRSQHAAKVLERKARAPVRAH